jgi:TonB family protein
MTVWMLYAMLVAGLAAVAGLALDYAARVLRIPARFAWLLVLAIAIVSPFAIPVLQPALADVAATPGESSIVATGPVSAVTLAPSIVDRLSAVAPVLDRVLLIAWALLTVVCLARFARSILTLRRRRADWIHHEIAGTRLYVTPDIGPAVVALPDSRIILPEWMLSLDADSLATVIRHERQHSIAGDTWLIVGGSLGVAVMPWNPALWFIRRRLRLALEMDCDARVLAEEPHVERYGSLLLAIAQHPRLAPGLAATLTESTSDLERRIHAMTARPPKNPRARALAFAVVGAGMIMLACTVPAPDAVAPRAADPLAKPIAASDVLFDFQVEQPVAADPSNQPPRYPDLLRAAKVTGGVTARFVVDTAGHVDMGTFLVMKSDHEAFTAAVREALPSMRFHPARVGDRPVKQLVSMPFMFSLVADKPAVRAEPVEIPQPMVFSEVPVSSVRKPAVLSETPAGRTGEFPEPLKTNGWPAYPSQLRAARVEGMVMASFTVKADGNIDMSTFRISRSDHDAFTAAVRGALASWQFRPALGKDGQPVAATMEMPFIFKLSK